MGERRPPTPARLAFGGGAHSGGDDPTPLPVREVELDGALWRLEVVGRGRAGRVSRARAPLLHLTARPVDDGEEGSGAGAPSIELLLVGSVLTALPESMLIAELKRAVDDAVNSG